MNPAPFSPATLISQLQSRLASRDIGCDAVRHWLPGYLDGALPEGRRGMVLRGRMARHLNACASCRAELNSYQALSRIMLGVSTDAPPAELPVALRVSVAKAREAGTFSSFLENCKHRWDLLLDHFIEPLMVPVSGGALVALIVFSVVFPTLGRGLSVPLSAGADMPTMLLQPARLQTLAGFPLSELAETSPHGASPSLVVEATVNSDGQAVSYRVIGEPLDAGMQREVDRVVLFSRFRPQMNFGRPTSSGRVVLGFSRVTVRG